MTWSLRDSLRGEAHQLAREALGKADWALPQPFFRAVWRHHAFWFMVILATFGFCECRWYITESLSASALLAFMQLVAVLPVTLVGALVPFMVLLVQLGAGPEGAVIRRERAWHPLRAVLLYAGGLLLIVTLTGGIFGASAHEGQVALSATARVAVLVVGALVVISIVLGTRFVVVAINMLAPEFLFEEARRTLRQAVYRSLFTEARARAMTSLFRAILQEHDAKETWVERPDLNCVPADRAGTLIDIRERLLRRNLKSLTKTIPGRGTSASRALFKVMPGAEVTRGQPLAYLAADEPRASKRMRSLGRALVIGTEITDARSDLRGALEDFKQLGMAAVDIGHQMRFRQVIAVYEDLLRTYMATGLRVGEKQARDLLARWGFLLLLQSDLDDLAARACGSRDRHFIGDVLFEYRRLLTAALDERDLLVFISILEVYPGAYWRAVDPPPV